MVIQQVVDGLIEPEGLAASPWTCNRDDLICIQGKLDVTGDETGKSFGVKFCKDDFEDFFLLRKETLGYFFPSWKEKNSSFLKNPCAQDPAVKIKARRHSTQIMHFKCPIKRFLLE